MTSAESLLSWALLLLLIRAVFSPLLLGLYDAGSKFIVLPLTLLIAGYFYWVLSLGGIAPLGWRAAISWMLTFALAFVGQRFLKKPSVVPRVDIEDAVFWGVFLLCVWIRFHMGSWTGSEKFPDMAFFQAAFRDDVYPPMDRWLPAEKINYYYMSFVFFVPLARLVGEAPEVTVNLSVCTVLAMSASMAYGFVHTQTRSVRFSLLAAGYMSVLGNLEWIKQAINGHFFSGFSWWNSSRSIPYAITEFPFFSFLLGDFHPHYTSLPWFGLTLWLLTYRRAWGSLPVLALSLGVHYPLNAWPFPVLVLICVGLFRKEPFKLAVIGVLSFVFFAPYWFQFQRPISGIYFIPLKDRSLWSDLLYHWLPFVIPLLWLKLRRLTKADWQWFPLTIAFFKFGTSPGLLAILIFLFRGWIFRKDLAGLWFSISFFLIVFCEFFSLDPTYGDPWLRMNTVFKFYMVAWWLLALATATVLSREGAPAWLLCAVVLLGSIYPVKATQRRFSEMAHQPQTLNGVDYWNQTFPGEAPALSWLKAHGRKHDVLFEAVGPPYQEYGRYSVFSGLPVFVGWVNHENVWRKYNTKANDRDGSFQAVLRSTHLSDVGSFLRAQNIRWILIGELERKKYSETLKANLKHYPLVFRAPGSEIRLVP